MLVRTLWACLILATAPASAAVAFAHDPAVDGAPKRMQGAWTTDSFAGNPTTFTFAGHRLEVKAEGIEYVIAITLNEKARPEKTIDMKTEESTTARAVGKS